MVKVLCYRGTAVAQWLRCCAVLVRSQLVSLDFFIDIKSFLGFDSASNRNEYQEHFLGVKATGA